MSTTVTTTDSPDDIDLLLLAERTILFFRRYKWAFLVAAILGLAVGFLIYSRLPKVYRSRMIVHSYTLSNQDYLQVIDNWNTLLKRREYDALTPGFGLPARVLTWVKEIKGSEIQKVFTAANPNGFYIDVLVTDNDVLDTLQQGILSAMENVDYIKKQLEIKRENLRTLIDDVAREIIKMDSTKTKIESMINNNSGHASSMFVDISGLNKQLIELNEKYLYYQQDLKLTSAVQLLQGFSKFNTPAGPNMIVWLGLGLIGSLALAYFYAIFDSISRKLKMRRVVHGKPV